MPSYKVTYFALKGQAEPIRFILSYGGADFEDDRVTSENWPKIKPSTPFGQLPVLEVDGKKIYQSVAISRYLGKQYGIAGKNDWEALEIDAAVATIDDLRAKLRRSRVGESPREVVTHNFATPAVLLRLKESFYIPEIAAWHYESNPIAKEPKYDRLFKETIPYFLERLDAQVKANRGYFVGGALSWADLFFVGLLDYIIHMAKCDILEKYENLKQLRTTILELPKIKAWVERRPVTIL